MYCSNIKYDAVLHSTKCFTLPEGLQLIGKYNNGNANGESVCRGWVAALGMWGGAVELQGCFLLAPWVAVHTQPCWKLRAVVLVNKCHMLLARFLLHTEMGSCFVVWTRAHLKKCKLQLLVWLGVTWLFLLFVLNLSQGEKHFPC